MASAWAAFVSGGWGAPEIRRPAHFAELARHPAVDLPPELAQVFLQGCSVTPGFAARIEEAFSCTDTTAMDPRARLHTIRCRVHLFHGRVDDVVPYSPMDVLAAALPDANPKTYVTGLYDHSRGAPATTPMARLKEVRTMAGMVRALVLRGTRAASPDLRVSDATISKPPRGQVATVTGASPLRSAEPPIHALCRHAAGVVPRNRVEPR